MFKNFLIRFRRQNSSDHRAIRENQKYKVHVFVV